MKRILAVLALTLVAVFGSIGFAKPVSAAGFYAGTIYSDHNRGGSSLAVYFNNVGTCDRAGYTVDLVGTNYWFNRISSVHNSFANGCNSFRVLGCDQHWYYYYGASDINAPYGWNDCAYRVNFFRA